VRLSGKDSTSKENAVLVNAHLDSTLPSPGAADDLYGVATMLEALRIMSGTPTRLHNSVIFLFNCAEESLQDASHLYITQHETRHTVRSVINIEAAGTEGKDILFQATNEQMVRAYAHVPYPYGTIMATEIFGTGVLCVLLACCSCFILRTKRSVSDTDFRQFVDYGNLTGLDMALIKNSYLYRMHFIMKFEQKIAQHYILDTRQDLADNLQPGSLRHMGENLISMLGQLTLPGTKLKGQSEQFSPPVFFSAFGGKVFVVYTFETAFQIYAASSVILLAVLYDRVRRDQIRQYFLSFVGIFASLFGGIITANVVALVMDFRKPLSWSVAFVRLLIKLSFA